MKFMKWQGCFVIFFVEKCGNMLKRKPQHGMITGRAKNIIKQVHNMDYDVSSNNLSSSFLSQCISIKVLGSLNMQDLMWEDSTGLSKDKKIQVRQVGCQIVLLQETALPHKDYETSKGFWRLKLSNIDTTRYAEQLEPSTKSKIQACCLESRSYGRAAWP